MDKLHKLLSSLPKAKLSGQADRRIKFKLYRLIFLSRLESFFALPSWKVVIFNKGMAVFLIMAFLLGATSIYAYADSSIIPGSQLYPLKIALEKIEQKITISTPAKIAVYEKLSARRLQEAVILSEKNLTTNKVVNHQVSEDIKNTIKAEVDNHTAVVNSINNLNDHSKVEAVINQAKKNDQAELDSLNKVAEYAQSVKDEAVLQKVNEAKEIIDHQNYNYNQESDKNNSTETKVIIPESLNKNTSDNQTKNNEKASNENSGTTCQNCATSEKSYNQESNNNNKDNNRNSGENRTNNQRESD